EVVNLGRGTAAEKGFLAAFEILDHELETAVRRRHERGQMRAGVVELWRAENGIAKKRRGRHRGGVRRGGRGGGIGLRRGRQNQPEQERGRAHETAGTGGNESGEQHGKQGWETVASRVAGDRRESGKASTKHVAPPQRTPIFRRGDRTL